MTTRKPVSAPDMSGLGKSNPLLSRFGTDVPAPEALATVPAPRAKKAVPLEMDRRSWYMPKAVAEALSDEIDELHFTTRRPKWAVLMAIIAVAMDHKDEISAKLTGSKDGARDAR